MDTEDGAIASLRARTRGRLSQAGVTPGVAYFANRVPPSQLGNERTRSGRPSSRIAPRPIASANLVRPRTTLLPVALQFVGFGVILSRDPAAVTTAALFGWLGVFWGGALGAGIRTTGAEPADHVWG